MSWVRNAVCKTSEELGDEMSLTVKEPTAEPAPRCREAVSSATLETLRTAVDNPSPPTPELVELMAKHRRAKAGRSRR